MLLLLVYQGSATVLFKPCLSFRKSFSFGNLLSLVRDVMVVWCVCMSFVRSVGRSVGRRKFVFLEPCQQLITNNTETICNRMNLRKMKPCEPHHTALSLYLSHTPENIEALLAFRSLHLFISIFCFFYLSYL